MDISTAFTGLIGAVCAVLGYLAKDLVDILKQERAHTLDLQKRYFDQKFAVTMQTVKQLKWFAVRMLEEYRLIKLSLEQDGAVHHVILLRFSEQQQQQAAQLAAESVGIDALLPFFYSEEALAKGNALRECTDKILPPLSRALRHMDYLKMWGDCHGDPRFDASKLAELEATEEKALLASITELVPLLEEYNQRIDEAIRLFANEFRHFRT